MISYIAYAVIRDGVVIGKFWTPGAAHQFMIDTKHVDEASGIDPMPVSYIETIEINQEDEHG